MGVRSAAPDGCKSAQLLLRSQVDDSFLSAARLPLPPLGPQSSTRWCFTVSHSTPARGQRGSRELGRDKPGETAAGQSGS